MGHDQRHRVGEHESAQAHQEPWLVFERRALLKLFYLALRNISKKWTMPIRDWKAALNRFTILFEGRIPQR